MARYARSRVLRNPTVGQLVRYFRRSTGGVGGGRDRGLGGKMVLLGPARVSAVEQPTEVESQVAGVVWLAHGGSLIRAVPEHLVDGSPLDTTLFGAANPDAALPGASRLRDLRNRRRTMLLLRNLRLNLNVWMLGKIPKVERQQQYGHLFPPSADPDVVLVPPNSPLPERIPVSFARSMLDILDLVTVLDVFSHDQIHTKAHTKSQQIHLACTRNQDLFFVMDSQSMSMRQIMLMLGEETYSHRDPDESDLLISSQNQTLLEAESTHWVFTCRCLLENAGGSETSVPVDPQNLCCRR